MNVEAVSLAGGSVRLDPATADDAAAMMRAAGDPSAFRYFPSGPEPWSEAGWRSFLGRLLARPDWLVFTVRDAGGEVVGSSSYLEIRPADRGLEIGCTWIAPALRGARVNPAMKLAMMRHAFETLGAVRVQLKTDSRNARSLAALRKLGAVEEGILRNHVVMPDGVLRHSVVFSVTPEEWPAVRRGLEARIGA